MSRKKHGPETRPLRRRLADRLARLAGFPELPEEIDEVHARRSARVGANANRLWYLRQLLALAGLAAKAQGRHIALVGPRSGQAVRRLARRPALSLSFAAVVGLGLAATAFMAEVLGSFSAPDLGIRTPLHIVQGIDSAGNVLPVLRPRDEAVPWSDPPASVGRLIPLESVRSWALTPNGRFVRTMHQVPPGFLSELGRSPLVGRDLEGPDEAVLGVGFWRLAFGEDRGVLGQTVQLPGRTLTVVGIAPRDFDGPLCCVPPDLWISPPADHQTGWIRLLVAAGVRDADAAGIQLLPLLEGAHPRLRGVRLTPLDAVSFGDDRGVVQRSLKFLLGLAVLVWLATLLNGTNLLVADLQERARELRLRRALGAGGPTLAAQFAVEVGMLALLSALVAAAAGVLLMAAAPHLLPMVGPDNAVDLRLGATATAVLAAGAAATAVLCATPATVVALLSSAATDPGRSARQGRGAGLVLGGQVALAIVLVTAVLMLRGTIRQLDGDFVGFRHGDTRVHRLQLASAAPPTVEEVRTALAGQPGVGGVALTRRIPVYGASRDSVSLGARVVEDAAIEEVTPDYFATIGLRIVSGRAARSRGEAVISSDLARQLGASAAGTVVLMGGSDSTTGEATVSEEVLVVGVAEPATWSTGAPRPTLYRGWDGQTVTGGILLIRPTSGSAAPGIGRIAAALTPLGLAGDAFGSYDDVLVRTRVLEVFLARIAGVFGVLCLIVVGSGVFAHFTRWVRSRDREMGIRHALGAPPGRLRSSVYLAALPWLMLGIGAGTFLAFAAGTTAGRTIGLSAPGPGTLSLAVLAVVLLCGATLVPPAIRVAPTDPLALLRNE